MESFGKKEGRKGEVPAKRQHSPKTLKPTIKVCSCAPVGASRKRMSRASLQDHAPIMHLVISEVDSPKSDVWTVLIDHPKDLGRGTGCTIPKEEVRVSRKHCCIAKVSKSAHLSCLKRLWVLHKASGQLSEHPPGTKLLVSGLDSARGINQTPVFTLTYTVTFAPCFASLTVHEVAGRKRGRER